MIVTLRSGIYLPFVDKRKSEKAPTEIPARFIDTTRNCTGPSDGVK